MKTQELQKQNNMVRELQAIIKDLESNGNDAQKVMSKILFYIIYYTHLAAFRKIRNKAYFSQTSNDYVMY